MLDSVDGTAFNNEQGNRARKLFAAVVLAALDDAIADDKKYGNGPEQIARWARSRDGREVLSCAGIDPNERVVSGLMEFVSKGVRTSVALSREGKRTPRPGRSRLKPFRTAATVTERRKRAHPGRVFFVPYGCGLSGTNGSGSGSGTSTGVSPAGSR